MKGAYITEGDILAAADVGTLAAEMRDAYGTGMVRSAIVPQRFLMTREAPYVAFATMPALSEPHGLFVTKIGTVVSRSHTKPTSESLVVAFSAETGAALAVLDGIGVTNLKCAAVSAMVTDICAAPHSRVLAIIGSGVQAREQIRGVSAVRALEQIRVYSRDPRNVRSFIRACAGLARGAQLVACSSASEAVDQADVLSTATSSTEPVVSASSLHAKGLHVNCMGAHTRRSRELPPDILTGSLLIVEDVAQAVVEAGELHGQALSLEAMMRQSRGTLHERRTVFSSTGHAFLDLLACAHVLGRLGLRASQHVRLDSTLT